MLMEMWEKVLCMMVLCIEMLLVYLLKLIKFDTYHHDHLFWTLWISLHWTVAHLLCQLGFELYLFVHV